MKKILLALVLMTLAVTSQAQFVVSAQLGGFSSSGTITPTPNIYTGPDSIHGLPGSAFNTPNDTVIMAKPLDFTGGIKFGYQYGRIQAGIAASFSWGTTYSDMTPKEYADRHSDNPYCIIKDVYIPGISDYTGWTRENHWELAVAPYVRYEAITLGDVAFFLEVNGYYKRTFRPWHHEYVDFYRMEMHNTVDTTFRISDSSSSLGVKLIPGLSWQLTPHCYIDLYLDLLAFSFDKTTQNTVTVKDEWDLITIPYIIARSESVSTTTTITTLGFEALGSPKLSTATHSWVRVGFNYTF